MSENDTLHNTVSTISRRTAIIRSIFISRFCQLFVCVRWWWKTRIQSAKIPTHDLPINLIVSLTSYPPRFPTLHLTLKCLLMQSVKPNEVVLWVAHQDFDKLKSEILDLIPYGLTIKTCSDIRSYKKLVPQLSAEPKSAVITVDDDMYYDRNFVKDLVAAYNPHQKEVLCLRANKIQLMSDGVHPAPYNMWIFDTTDNESSSLIFPTGVGGVLYMPGVLHPDVSSLRFMKLCPTGDDIWFFWMGARAGSLFRKVGPRRRSVNWTSSQDVSLWKVNQLANGNDPQIANMIKNFGMPWGVMKQIKRSNGIKYERERRAYKQIWC